MTITLDDKHLDKPGPCISLGEVRITTHVAMHPRCGVAHCGEKILLVSSRALIPFEPLLFEFFLVSENDIRDIRIVAGFPRVRRWLGGFLWFSLDFLGDRAWHVFHPEDCLCL